MDKSIIDTVENYECEKFIEKIDNIYYYIYQLAYKYAFLDTYEKDDTFFFKNYNDFYEILRKKYKICLDKFKDKPIYNKYIKEFNDGFGYGFEKGFEDGLGRKGKDKSDGSYNVNKIINYLKTLKVPMIKPINPTPLKTSSPKTSSPKTSAVPLKTSVAPLKTSVAPATTKTTTIIDVEPIKEIKYDNGTQNSISFSGDRIDAGDFAYTNAYNFALVYANKTNFSIIDDSLKNFFSDYIVKYYLDKTKNKNKAGDITLEILQNFNQGIKNGIKNGLDYNEKNNRKDIPKKYISFYYEIIDKHNESFVKKSTISSVNTPTPTSKKDKERSLAFTYGKIAAFLYKKNKKNIDDKYDERFKKYAYSIIASLSDIRGGGYSEGEIKKEFEEGFEEGFKEGFKEALKNVKGSNMYEVIEKIFNRLVKGFIENIPENQPKSPNVKSTEKGKTKNKKKESPVILDDPLSYTSDNTSDSFNNNSDSLSDSSDSFNNEERKTTDKIVRKIKSEGNELTKAEQMVKLGLNEKDDIIHEVLISLDNDLSNFGLALVLFGMIGRDKDDISETLRFIKSKNGYENIFVNILVKFIKTYFIYSQWIYFDHVFFYIKKYDLTEVAIILYIKICRQNIELCNSMNISI